jgi:LETM1 and EF-hand domain-containing protein 1
VTASQILWEGIDSLTVLELREACRDRGMRAHGMNTVRYEKQLKDWLELSIQKNIPISLLIMSRAFLLTSPIMTEEEVLKSSISALDEDTINEVVLAVASPTEEGSADMKQRKLESIQFQEEVCFSPSLMVRLIILYCS